MNKFRLFGFEFETKEVTIFIVIGILLILGPEIFTLILGYNSFIGIGEIGDTFGGLTSPFLSYFGSILVFLALKAQIEANNKIAQQFEEQNTDQLFFRVFENFKELRKNSSYTPISNGHVSELMKGQEAIRGLAKDFKFYLNNHYLLEYSFHIIENDFETLNEELILSIAYGIRSYTFGKTTYNPNEFIENLKKIPNKEKRDFILSQYSQYNKVNDLIVGRKIHDVYIDDSFFKILTKIGEKHFYDYEFKLRFNSYRQAAFQFKKNRKDSLDGLANTFEHLFLIIRNSKNKKTYYEYLFYNIDESEKFILFSFLLCYESLSVDFRKDLKSFFSQFDLKFSNNYFINYPNEEIVKREVENILNSID
ncbi:MAG: hypothetical protein ACO1N0_01655 [Fluviicola sp.]